MPWRPDAETRSCEMSPPPAGSTDRTSTPSRDAAVAWVRVAPRPPRDCCPERGWPPVRPCPVRRSPWRVGRGAEPSPRTLWLSVWLSTLGQTARNPASRPGFTFRSLEPTLGFEPRTCCLRNSCSTAELCRRGGHLSRPTALGQQPGLDAVSPTRLGRQPTRLGRQPILGPFRRQARDRLAPGRGRTHPGTAKTPGLKGVGRASWRRGRRRSQRTAARSTRSATTTGARSLIGNSSPRLFTPSSARSCS